MARVKENLNNKKKCIIFSNVELKNKIEELVCIEAKSRGISQSLVIEELIILSLIKHFPEQSQMLQDEIKRRHEEDTKVLQNILKERIKFSEII